MRKVLLATTALVAMTGAAAADVTVSGYYEFGYSSTNDDRTTNYDSMFDDTEVHIAFDTTSDSGLAYGMKVEFEGSADNAHDDGDTSGDSSDDVVTIADEASMYISGDFGKITLGENDGAASDGILWSGGAHMIGGWDSSVPTVGSGGGTLMLNDHIYYGPGSDAIKVKYNSPNVGGFTFAYSMAGKTAATESEDTEVSVKYSMEMGGVGVTVSAGMHDSGESSDTNEAAYQMLSLNSGDATITAGRSTHNNSTTKDVDSTLVGVDYALNDQMTVHAEWFNAQNGVSGDADELTATGLGVSYNIASGLNLGVAHHSYEVVDATTAGNKNDGSVTVASITVSF
jgi:outer membrane protein OmpU